MKSKEESEKPNDLSEKLLETRTIVISEQVDAKLTKKVIQQLLLLEAKDSKSKVTVLINSPGGEVYSGWAIFDMLQFIECPIRTIVMGFAASMGSVLSLAADKGQRFALPNSKIMIHQPLISGGVQGQATDLAIHSEQILKTRKKIAELYSKQTGKSVKIILQDMDRDHWLTAEEALKYGLLDQIITKRKDLK